jgi:predicted DCC family thiol-disulfide oxidoreductase YuxK
VCDALGWPWKAARAINLLPRPLRDWLYGRIANNRYGLFGKKESCEIPSGELRERIIG